MKQNFEGFSPEAIDFLWGIRMNNNRDWFLAHKQDYINFLYEPMKALGADLFQPFLDSPGTLLKVSRIYRDTRLHHPDPYKESLWISIREDAEYWGEHPCLFLDIHPEGIRYGFGLHAPRPAAMERFRQYIASHPEEFLKLIEDTEKAAGIPLSASLYKRAKPAEDPRLQPYFQWKSDILCVRQENVGPGIYEKELEQRTAQLFAALTPLYDFFRRILAEP